MASQVPIRSSIRNKRLTPELLSQNASKRVKKTSRSIPPKKSLIVKLKLPISSATAPESISQNIRKPIEKTQAIPSKRSLIVKFKLPISSATATTPDRHSDWPGTSTLTIPTPEKTRARKPSLKASILVGNKKSSPPCGQAASLLGPPFGSPPAWANDRQPLCESLEYYRAYKGSTYCHGGVCYGFLIDFASADGQYMDEEIVITRAGGACEMTEQGIRQQAKSQTYKSAHIATFEKNMRENIPIGIIFGSKHTLALAAMPHRFNVGAWFQVTAIWAEMNGPYVVYMFRFQKINLHEKSWWAPQNSPMPPTLRDYQTKASRASCIDCRCESPQIYKEGWICVSHEKCPKRGKLDGRYPPSQLTFSQDFLAERTLWPSEAMPHSELVPSDRAGNSLDQHHTTSLAAWKGFVCPKCRCCNSRIDWDYEKCQAKGCDYSHRIYHPVVPHLSVLPQHVLEVHGHAISQDEYRGHVDHPSVQYLGHWKLITYKLCEDNFVTHFFANKHINGRPGGANDMFLAMQEGDSLNLKRSYMKNSIAQGRQLTRHFARNFGMPYNYIAAADSAPFSEAPSAIMESLNKLTWASNVVVGGKPYPPRNELLAVGYMETQKMDYHDDGEKELDDLVSTWSLGAPGEMFFRIKKSYAHPVLREATYNPQSEVVMGSDYWKARAALTGIYLTGTSADFQQAKAKLFAQISKDQKTKAAAEAKKKRVSEEDGDDSEPAEDEAEKEDTKKCNKKSGLAPWCLRLYLRHGDFVVMHGAKIHAAYEHAVVPSGKLRYAMTARYVRPELVNSAEHWRGNFTLPQEDTYDGDIDLPVPNFSDIR